MFERPSSSSSVSDPGFVVFAFEADWMGWFEFALEFDVLGVDGVRVARGVSGALVSFGSTDGCDSMFSKGVDEKIS